MGKFRYYSGSAALLAMLFMATPSFAIKAYTTDTQEVPLRAKPNNGSKAIGVIPPASPVELLNSNSWALVRYAKPGGEARDGWVPSRFLGARPPESTIAKELGAENAALREQLNAIEREKTGLFQREKELTEKLTKLNTIYEDLKNGSANYLKLKSEY
ncbi:MAG: hypothetical protein AAGU11_13045, partial [Syntrophobacteraceae bacterium]